MKFHPLFPGLAFGFVGMATLVSAQNPPGLSAAPENRFLGGRFEVSRPEAELLIQVQKSSALDFLSLNSLEMSSDRTADTLKLPSIYQEISTTGLNRRFESAQKGVGDNLALLSAIYRQPATPAGKDGCSGVALSVERRIGNDLATMLETIAAEIAANPSCACEIVKSVIQASLAESSLVVAIVETAVIAAPDQMRVISQCAIASAPESLSAIQELLAKLDPNAGESVSQSKSSKTAKYSIGFIQNTSADLPAANPLDLLSIRLVPPQLMLPPPVTEVDPQTALR